MNADMLETDSDFCSLGMKPILTVWSPSSLFASCFLSAISISWRSMMSSYSGRDAILFNVDSWRYIAG